MVGTLSLMLLHPPRQRGQAEPGSTGKARSPPSAAVRSPLWPSLLTGQLWPLALNLM